MSKKNMLVKWDGMSWQDIDDVVHVNDERIDTLLRPGENNRIFDYSVENNKKYYYSFGPDMSTGGNRLYDPRLRKYNPLYGDMRHGFFGEVSANDFITGDELASRLGITQGTSFNSNTEWLEFALNTEIIFIPKKPIRYGISWDHIYSRGAVYESQNTIVTIGGFDFLVTLLRGANPDPFSGSHGHDLSHTHGSEWNKLMYPIHSGVHTDNRNPSNPSEPYNQWVSYSDADLLVHGNFGNGAYSWCQESNESSNHLVRVRGGTGVSRVESHWPSLTGSHFGWRVALRLVR